MKCSTSLSNEEKEKINILMKLDYISSEESASDSENCEDGFPRRTFVIRPLAWLSDEATTLMSSLDRKASRRRSERGSEMMIKRKIGMPSVRGCPEDCPEWARQ